MYNLHTATMAGGPPQLQSVARCENVTPVFRGSRSRLLMEMLGSTQPTVGGSADAGGVGHGLVAIAVKLQLYTWRVPQRGQPVFPQAERAKKILLKIQDKVVPPKRGEGER